MPKTKEVTVAILNFLTTISLQVPVGASEEKGATYLFSGRYEGKTNPIPKSATKGKRFDPEYWAMSLSYPTSRLEMFNFFLQDNDLVGMKQEKIILLLGEGYSLPDGYKGNFRLLHYSVMGGGCDPSDTVGINILLKQGKAIGWCFTHHDKCSQLFTENVLIQIKRDVRSDFMRIGTSSEIKWPEVTPKHMPETECIKGREQI